MLPLLVANLCFPGATFWVRTPPCHFPISNSVTLLRIPSRVSRLFGLLFLKCTDFLTLYGGFTHISFMKMLQASFFQVFKVYEFMEL